MYTLVHCHTSLSFQKNDKCPYLEKKGVYPLLQASENNFLPIGKSLFCALIHFFFFPPSNSRKEKLDLGL